MQKHHIEKLVEEIINSFDGAKKAEPKPFLLTRVLARMQGRADVQNNIWARAGSFLSKPAVALAGLVLIVLVNAAIIMSNNDDNSSVQNLTSSKDDFAINVISIYDNENQEP